MKGYIGWIVAGAMAMLALAGDPTCLSDVDGDDNVGTSDLLQVLSDWGPCPAPPIVVDLLSNSQDRVVYRLWSDGTIEYRGYQFQQECDPPTFCTNWHVAPDDGVAHGERVTAIANENPFSPGHRLFRVWDNGVVQQYWTPFLEPTLCDEGAWCGWQVVP